MPAAGREPEALTSERCAHCALPLPRRRRAARGGAHAAGPRFCCAGCSVADALAREGGAGSGDALAARLALSAFLAMGVMVFSLSLYGAHFGGGDGEELASDAAHALRGLFRLGALALSTPIAWLLGVPLVAAVWRSRRFLSADALVLAGTGAAWLSSVWSTLAGGGEVYFETASMVLLLYALGRYLDVRARERARGELERILPDALAPATVLRDGVERELEARALVPGDVVRVRPGEHVPVDGLVLEGRAFVDAASLTGEAEPRSVRAGDRVLAGSAALDGALLVRAERVGGERARDAIERLLAESLVRRGRLVRIADRLAGALLPVVLLVALGAALWHWPRLGPTGALMAALSVVLISCPCALGIATPLAYWTALGRASALGVLVRGGDALERLARARRVLFDKTGTLTSGELELVAVHAAPGAHAGEALRLAAAVELASEHPIGRGLRAAWLAQSGARLDALPAALDFRALPGVGVEAEVEGARVRVERAPDADAAGVPDAEPGAGAHTVVRLLSGGRELARFELAARLRPEARETVARLRAEGLELGLLSGDGAGPTRAAGEALGLAWEAALLPAEKVARVRAAGARTAFVGDGLNDAAALAAAEVGIAMAGSAPLSAHAAEIALLRPSLAPLPELVRLARAALRVARQNLAWAFAYNAVGLAYAASGRLNPILAAGAMVASSVAVVLNSRRLVRGAEEERPDGAPAGSLLLPREGQHRDLGVPQDGLGDAAERQVAEAGAPVGR